MQRFSTRDVKGALLTAVVKRRFRKEVPFFCQKWFIKNRGWTSGQSLPYKTLLSSLRIPSFPFLLIWIEDKLALLQPGNGFDLKRCLSY